jgi:NADH-quinone oxidoreductase subunit L
MTDYVWLIIALPLLGAVVLHLVGSRLKEPLAGYIASVMSIGAFGVAVAAAIPVFKGDIGEAEIIHLWDWMPSLGASFTIQWDPLSIAMALLVTGVGSLIHVYSIGYMHGDERFSRYFTYLNFFAASMLILVLAGNFAMVFLGWELVGLSSYLLIGFWFTHDLPPAAAKKAFVLNRVGDFGFLIALMLIFKHFGTFDFGVVLNNPAAQIAGGTATAIGLLLLLGATGKSAQMPLFVWLPDAMAGPTPASALIHAATMVTAGVYMVARTAPIFDLSTTALTTVALVGVVTAFIAATIAVVQNDIKKVLAYSTISQLGYMFIGVGSAAYSAGIFHLVTHAFFKALLFLGAGSVIHSMGGEQDMRKMGGLFKKMKVTGWTMAVATLAIAGIPPLAGFWSKDEILAAAFARGGVYQAIWALGLVTALLTAFYMTRWFFMVFLGEPNWDEGIEPHESPQSMSVPLVILAVLAAVGGLMNTPFFTGFSNFLHPVFAAVHEQHAPDGTLEYLLLAISIVVAVAGVAAGWLFYRGSAEARAHLLERYALRMNFFENGWNINSGYERFVVKPLGTLAEGAAEFDNKVIDSAVNGVASVVGWTGAKLQLVQTGFVRSYGVGILSGTIGLVVWILMSRGR